MTPARTIILDSQRSMDAATRLLPTLPIDAGLEIVIRPHTEARKLTANAAMWAGPLTDIAHQAWTAGRQYSAEIWHIFYKREFLPEEYDPEHCKSEKYQKWDYTPHGERVIVGSTGDLTKHGFHIYMLQLEGHGANLGVLYSATPAQAEMHKERSAMLKQANRRTSGGWVP